ncbi:Gfo/Idh/MocA family protein [Engelhardtia mirabilis]|uniref:1,5-anhydro-D-fructose reductase n=1 Tax=Engelhardtia mirabilis TaxID=2528011 RepID=A0A518BEE9_9BACT|nr:1,5-anhydro-D-fructose reductase [Planctomycetes bacterium Pla133]QDU99693.1 1,5-anhydro-D-fructose reductase [Planctomycetes bacterium Pla86]
MTDSLRVGLIGSGFLARTRARCWARVHGVAVERAAVASSARAKADEFAARTGFGRGLSVDELLAEESIDLVDLCVPNRVHRELTERAAAAGKHVLCTKPLAAYWGQGLGDDASAESVAAVDRQDMYLRALADANAMVEACGAAGVKLFYGENWIFAPAVQRAAQLQAASNGLLLEMRGWESHSGSHSPYSKDWRHTGGGALLRLGAHPIGAMLWLKRREGLRRRGTPTVVTSVTAEVADPTASAILDGARTAVATGWKGVESWGMAVLHFDDGTRGTVFGSDLMLGGMQSHLSLMGSDHRFECALSPHDQLRAYAPDDGTFGSEYVMEKVDGQAGWSTPLPDEDWSSGQQGLLQAVAEDLTADREPRCSGALGLDVTRIVYAAYVSAAEGRRVELED